MRNILILMGISLIAIGCNDEAGDAKDPTPIFEAVIRHELKDAKKGEGFYLFVDGKDPAPELLKRVQKQFPDVQAGSKVPQGKAVRIAVDGLKFIDRNTAEVRGGSSNGMDGRGSGYRLVRNKDEWTIESVKVEVES